ncbi:MAG: hypothetical protein IJ615_00155 [Bacteroidaceae bacterium]|nr:hypothetical protein [Bacteroidaceae bacterium]
MNNDDLFRQALQRQNDRAAGMKMPDDMEQRVMGSLQTLSNPKTLSNSPLKGEKPSEVSAKEASPLRGGLVGSGRRLAWGCIAVAASVLLLIMLNTEKQQPEQQMPSIAEVMTMPQAKAPTEVTEQKQPAMAHAEKPKPTRRQRPAVRKKTIVETPAEEAAPMETPAEEPFPEDRLPDTNNPYLVAAAQLQDVRARGERLDREVAMLMNRP